MVSVRRVHRDGIWHIVIAECRLECAGIGHWGCGGRSARTTNYCNMNMVVWFDITDMNWAAQIWRNAFLIEILLSLFQNIDFIISRHRMIYKFLWIVLLLAICALIRSSSSLLIGLILYSLPWLSSSSISERSTLFLATDPFTFDSLVVEHSHFASFSSQSTARLRFRRFSMIGLN